MQKKKNEPKFVTLEEMLEKGPSVVSFTHSGKNRLSNPIPVPKRRRKKCPKK